MRALEYHAWRSPRRARRDVLCRRHWPVAGQLDAMVRLRQAARWRLARLPARSRIVADVHYRSTNRAGRRSRHARVCSSLAKPIRRLVGCGARGKRPSARQSRRSARRPDCRATHACGPCRPDLVPGIASIEVSARTPDGGTEILLLARNPAIEWPTPYIMKAPRLLRRGTEVSFVVQKRRRLGRRPHAPHDE